MWKCEKMLEKTILSLLNNKYIDIYPEKLKKSLQKLII